MTTHSDQSGTFHLIIDIMLTGKDRLLEQEKNGFADDDSSDKIALRICCIGNDSSFPLVIDP